MKRAIDVGLFGELADPRVAASLAARAEERGWDGSFVWDLLGLPAGQAGERLGIGARATKSRLHRARRALAASIASPGASKGA